MISSAYRRQVVTSEQRPSDPRPALRSHAWMRFVERFTLVADGRLGRRDRSRLIGSCAQSTPCPRPALVATLDFCIPDGGLGATLPEFSTVSSFDPENSFMSIMSFTASFGARLDPEER